MKVYEALANAFVAEGTDAVFGLMGDANQHWIEALDARGVRIFEVRHEGGGLSMADGLARITGKPGVCTTTSGPGTSQLATQMIVASRAHTPLVAFCGDTNWGDEEEVQHFNQERFAAAIECGFVRVATADGAHEAVRRAFYLARTESRPIMLSAPQDVQLRPFDDDEDYTPSTALLTNRGAYPNAATLERAAEIVASSSHVVIVAGKGAVSASAGACITSLANRTGALVATSLMAKGFLRDAFEYYAGISGLYATRTAMELFQDADCVIGVGASLNSYTTEHGYLFPNATFIQLDQKAQVVMGSGRSADCYLQCDARVGVEALDALLEAGSIHHVGYHTPQVKERLAQPFLDPTTYELEHGTVDPRDAVRALDEIMPKEIGLILSGGHQCAFGIMLCTRARELTLANSHHFSCIGQGLIVAIGAVIGANDRPCFLIDGDAGFMMHLAEFETAVRYHVPLLAVILNDQGLGAEFHKATAKGLNPKLAQISTPDLGAVARDLGGRGVLVRSIEELRLAARQFVESPGPMVIDVRVSPNVESVPYRRKFRGQEDV